MAETLRCLCGATELLVEGEPVAQFFCHCDDCKAVHGAAYIGVALYPRSAFRLLRGTPVVWTLRTLPRSRCGTCGLPLFAEVPDLDLVGVKGDLLPPGRFAPQFHIHCERAWRPVGDDLPHYRGLPAVFGGDDARVPW
jgi:hypothetical protein